MKTKTWVALILLIVLIGLVLALIPFIDLSILLEPRELRRFVRDFGALGPIVFVVVMALARMFFVPGLPIVVAGGIIFGWFGGFGLSLAGEILGATAAFFFARHIGRDWVRSRFLRHREKLKHYDEQLQKHGIKAVISLRLFNVLPFTPFDIALGLTRVRARQFIIGTLIGVTPGTLIASYLGEAIFELQAARIVAGLVLLVLLALAPLVYTKWIKGRT